MTSWMIDKGMLLEKMSGPGREGVGEAPRGNFIKVLVVAVVVVLVAVVVVVVVGR